MVMTGAYWPLIGGVIGHRGYANFPLLAYLPWFLVGIHLGARGRGIEGADLGLGAAATGAFLLFLWQEGRLPDRFPPSVLWVIGPGLILALYVWACERLGRRMPPALLAAGRHVLVSLVLSNLLIFAVRYQWGFPVQGGWAILGASLGLFGAVTLWGLLLDRLFRRGAA
jgi:hypothetical protein